MGAWVVGRNLAGYLPEGDVFAFADHAEAVEDLVDEMKGYADTDDDHAWDGRREDVLDDDEAPRMLATVDSIVADMRRDRTPGERDLSFTVEDNNGQNIEFWLMWDDEAVADEDWF